MGYSFFLFAKLHDAILGDSGEPYDIQYDDMVDMYDVYNASKDNDPNASEYGCIVDHLLRIKSERSIAKFKNLLIKHQS
jgi:hypothetical protein